MALVGGLFKENKCQYITARKLSEASVCYFYAFYVEKAFNGVKMTFRCTKRFSKPNGS